MKGGTLAGLCKEDKAKIGYLYQQWIKEKEEKEEILESYRYEKERFDQVLDLIQSQKLQEDKIKEKYDQVEQEIMKSRTGDDSQSYGPIPFHINSSLKEKELIKTPQDKMNVFASPRATQQSKKSELASPVEYFGKMFKDIKMMKSELSKMQNNIKSMVFSPERSAERTPNTSRSGFQQTTPGLTMKDLGNKILFTFRICFI